MSLLLQRCTSDCRSKPLARSKRSTTGIPPFGVTCPNHFLHIAIFFIRQRFHLNFVSCSVTPAAPKEPDISRGNRARRTGIDKMRGAGSIAFPGEIAVTSLRHRVNAVIALGHEAPGAQIEDHREFSPQPAFFG